MGRPDHWLGSAIACGHHARIADRRLVALGCGVDLAGNCNHIEQVPLRPDELAQIEALPRQTIGVDDPAFVFEGTWERTADSRGVSRTSTEPRASVTVKFTGQTAFLQFAPRPDAHIIQSSSTTWSTRPSRCAARRARPQASRVAAASHPASTR